MQINENEPFKSNFHVIKNKKRNKGELIGRL
jgi:hypothetical protein